jgi:hypothetical protein
MVAALPVMFVGYNEDWSSFYEGPGARPEIAIGENFVKANGERSFFLFMIARWACIPFSWLGAIVCYLWARDLYGRPSGVMACAIWCFEPNILAHASLITADAGATALGLAACYTFAQWLKRPTWSQVALTGVVLGLAELAKATLILFYPLWPLMWLFYRWPERSLLAVHDWLREGAMLMLRMAIGLCILNLGYGFEGTLNPLRNFEFVSDLFIGQELTVERRASILLNFSSPQSEASSPDFPNRFAKTWLGTLPVPFPKNYLLGIDMQQRDFEGYGRPSYLNGVWQNHGWWYYYLYACAIKVPISFWLLGILRLAYRPFFFRGLKTRNDHVPPTRDRYQSNALCDEFILLIPAIVIFAVVSSETAFSEHLRYVLPAFPFFFIWVSGNCLTLANAGVSYARLLPASQARLQFAPAVSNPLMGILCCWMTCSSLWIFPHSLSYFNESIGGPLNGPHFLLGSNVDWGQDLIYLHSLLSNRFETDDLNIIYYGYFSPTHVGFSPSKLLNLNKSLDIDHLLTDEVAISASILNGYPWFIYADSGAKVCFIQGKFKHLREMKVSARAGYSIYVLGAK